MQNVFRILLFGAIGIAIIYFWQPSSSEQLDATELVGPDNGQFVKAEENKQLGAPVADAQPADLPSAPEQALEPQEAAAGEEVYPDHHNCIPGLDGSRTTADGRVQCGCEYSGTASSLDGNWVCAGGRYTGSISSLHGNDVACGGLYTGSASSLDGNRVCAGGRYAGSTSSLHGNDVACGGLYTGTASSLDGNRVCAGGQYTGSTSSLHGNDVACGGLYTGSARSLDGTRICYGGRY